MDKFLSIAIALLFLQCCPAEAADPNCMKDYYRTRSADCVDSVLSQFRAAGSPANADPSTLTGFLAQLFIDSPEEKKRLLAAEPSQYVRSIGLTALYRAGLLDDARKFARDNNFTALLQKLETASLKSLAATRPSSTPADNDLLIGAYMASGDTVLIERILGNFSGLDDGAFSDAIRMGLILSKFGPTLTPKGREATLPRAACAKYQCKADPAKFYRLMTLATAFWSLQSMAQQDNGVRKTFNRFFENEQKKKLVTIEQVAFGNYLTALVTIQTFKPDQTSGVNPQTYEATVKEALAYENLESALTVFKPQQRK